MKKINPNIYTTLQILFIILLNSNITNSQVVFEKELKPQLYLSQIKSIPVLNLPALEEAKVKEAIKNHSDLGSPYKFGLVHEVNLTLENSGRWEILPNGDRIWQLKIEAPLAKTINLNYNKFDLPIGAKLYIYNESLEDILGPFTHQNESPNLKFATGFTRGESCIIEYHEPFKQRGKGSIEINGVVHGFRSLRNEISDIITEDYQDAGSCHYDVGCSIGMGWEDQVKSVAIILSENNSSGCTGTLINTTSPTNLPYFLTADHCFPNDNPGDLLNNIFIFNFLSPTPVCPGVATSPGPINQSVQGCTVLSKSDETDFCLLSLSTNPIDFYDVYYSGWDRTNTPASSAVGIHHSSGDVMKISIEEDPVVSSTDNKYWLVQNWDFGSTEGGASGSAVFDMASKRIIGQLCCGNADCNGSSNNGGEDDYGKIYYSWDQISTNPDEQLKPWLDPIGSGVLFVDGTNWPVLPTAAFDPIDQSTLTLCGPGNVQIKDKTTGIATSWSWTFSGAGVSPITSNLQNPLITINNTGTLTATLIANNNQGSDTLTQTYPVNFASCVEETFCGTSNLNIPDHDLTGISNSITLPSISNLLDFSIEIDVSHTFIGDLVISLEHGGDTSTLIYRPNEPVTHCMEDNINAQFNDASLQAAQSMCQSSGSGAITGVVRPQVPISPLYTTDPGGVWTIHIRDEAPEDTGVLNSWCIKAITTNSALSTELIDFSANYLEQEKIVALNWRTASEINNDYFMIEKSEDTSNWKELDRIDGQGTTSIISNYTSTDEAPSIDVINYYRLKQVDYDGSFSYSEIKSVFIPNSSKQKILVHPNPISAGSEINFTNQSRIKAINLFNTVGQQIYLSDTKIPENLSSGIYFLELTLKSGKKEIRRLIVK